MGFEAAGILSPMMMNSTSLLFAAAILLAAGFYQLALPHYFDEFGLVEGDFNRGKSVTSRANVKRSGLFTVTSITKKSFSVNATTLPEP